MKKIILLIAAVALIMSSCNNEKSASPEDVYAEFTVSANSADFVTLKSSPLTMQDGEVLPMCDDEMDYDAAYDHATITFDKGEGTETVDVPIYYVDGKFVTQPIKVMMGSSETLDVLITEFVVKDENGVTLKATPHEDSDFYQFINPMYGLRTVTLEKFAKKEFTIDVLCYDDLTYDYFGFVWFNIRPLTVRSLCVFGDICICETESYGENMVYTYMVDDVEMTYSYASQMQNGTLFDVVAITKVIITQEDGTTREYTNLGEPIDECLAIYWSDYDQMEDEVTMELKVLLPVGPALEWVSVKTITGNASGDFGEGDDMLDFVIGDCHTIADWNLPAHIHLPTTAVQMTPNFNSYNASNQYRYVRIDVANVPAGYSIVDGSYPGWCGDADHSIGGTSNTWLYSSLNWDIPVGNHLDQAKLKKLNFLVKMLANNPTLLPGYGANHSINGADVGRIVQTIIWKITNPGSTNFWGSYSATVKQKAQDLHAYLESNMPAVVNLEEGDMVAVMFYRADNVQILFTPLMSPCVEVFANELSN